MPLCCLCGGDEEVAWCGICQHYFCGDCRKDWWGRGRAGVKEHLFNVPPPFCQHKEAE
jgi:hypothetical protein